MSDAAWVHRWLVRAQDDLDTAKHLYSNYHPKKLEIICYLCQQTTEKALKAYMTQNDFAFPFTHDCRKLCLLCAEQENSFREFVDDCVDLTPYATQARYPDDDEITEEETASALRKAERIVSFCAKLIGPAPSSDTPADS